MNIDQLEGLLRSLKAQGLSGTTPVVLCLGDEEENEQMLYEVGDYEVIENTNYGIDSEKMALIRNKGTVVVLGTSCSPSILNQPDFTLWGSRDVTQQYSPIVQPSEVTVDFEEYRQTQQEARLWRGLLCSPAIRILGSSGVKAEQRKSSNYAHFGMEIWTHHTGDYDNETGRATITGYAEIMADNLDMGLTQVVTLPDTYEWGHVPTAASFVGEGVSMEVPRSRLHNLLNPNGELDIQCAKAVAQRQGICTDVTLKISYEPIRSYLVIPKIDGLDGRAMHTAWLKSDGKRIEMDSVAFDYLNQYDDVTGANTPNREQLLEIAVNEGHAGLITIEPGYIEEA